MSDTNDNFRDLKRLLKLKQHEIPPPGYFNQFSGDVISRIQAGDAGGRETLAERLGDGSFLANLLGIFQAKPGLVGGFATSLCLMLLIGVVMVDRSDSGSMGSNPMAAAQTGNDGQALAGVSLAPPEEGSGITRGSNGPVSLQPVPTLFGSQQNPLFQQAAFMPQQ